MTRLYLDQNLVAGETLPLPEAAVRHLVQVLRMSSGEALTVFNGKGGEYQAELVDVSRRAAKLAVSHFDPVNREAPVAVTIAQCVSKGERMEYALQKATELGAAGFVPVLSSRGNVKLDDDRWEKKVEHWQGVVIAAAEQSGRTALPQVASTVSFEHYVANATASQRYILAPGAGMGIQALPSAREFTVLIGPEGGFSPAELALAERCGWQRLGLGPRVLRTETAPVALMAALLTRFGDF